MQRNESLSRLFTIPATSRQLGISARRIRAAVGRGELEAIRLSQNGWPMLSEESIRAWLERHRMVPR